MKNGSVKFFNDAKGYGFIKDNDSENEYFTHVSGLIDEIKEDDLSPDQQEEESEAERQQLLTATPIIKKSSTVFTPKFCSSEDASKL